MRSYPTAHENLERHLSERFEAGSTTVAHRFHVYEEQIPLKSNITDEIIITMSFVGTQSGDLEIKSSGMWK